MTYPKSFSLYEKDAEIFQKMMELEPGQELVLRFQTKEGASAKRQILYGWLKNNKLKNFFRVKWPEETRIVVVKLEVTPEVTCYIEELSPKLDLIFKELVVTDTEEQAREILRTKKVEGIINAAELGELLCKYDEFMGK